MITQPIAITSRSFCRNQILRDRVLAGFANVKFNDAGLMLEGDELVKFLGDVDAAIVALNKINSSVLEKLPNLKFISKYGVGLNNIDQQALQQYEVELGWQGGVNKRAVSELTLANMLSLSRQLPRHYSNMRMGKWQSKGGSELSGKSVGIIGCGYIGGDLLKLLQAFSCEVLVNDIVDKTEICEQYGAKQVGLEDLLSKAKLVSIHIPHNEMNNNLISQTQFELMRKDVILINTSRGNIVDEAALFRFLDENNNASAAFDVFAEEPFTNEDLLGLSNFHATPHIGGGSEEGILAMGHSAIDNLERFFAAD